MLRLFFIFALISSSLFAETLSGHIIGISDGDTATLLSKDRKPIKIRLWQIDAPEKEQAFGEKSKQSLSDLIYGKNVTVQVETQDQYGRQVGKIFVGNKDINLEQIKRGMAWFYVEFGRDATYRDAESTAKAAQTGLWAASDPTPPWKWRSGSHSSRAPQPAVSNRAVSPATSNTATSNTSTKPSIPAQNYRCDGRTYCSQMSSCEEAKYFISHCPNVKMDGNNDGIPCEKQWCR